VNGRIVWEELEKRYKPHSKNRYFGRVPAALFNNILSIIPLAESINPEVIIAFLNSTALVSMGRLEN